MGQLVIGLSKFKLISVGVAKASHNRAYRAGEPNRASPEWASPIWDKPNSLI